jgi:hypothetical protein
MAFLDPLRSKIAERERSVARVDPIPFVDRASLSALVAFGILAGAK